MHAHTCLPATPGKKNLENRFKLVLLFSLGTLLCWVQHNGPDRRTFPLPPGTYLLCRVVEGSSVGKGAVACFLYPCLPKEGKPCHPSWLRASPGLPNASKKEKHTFTEHSSGCYLCLPGAILVLKDWRSGVSVGWCHGLHDTPS